jgi:restriction system protein
MPIPTFAELMLPVLKHSAEKTWLMKGLINQIADDLHLTPEERAARGANNSPFISYRIHWAKTYLKHAGLIEQPKRAEVRITKLGQSVLDQNPSQIDVKSLYKFDGFAAFMKGAKTKDGEPPPEPPPNGQDGITPDEQIDVAASTLNVALKDALLARILEGSPEFFEKLILDLLLSMGYGGSRADAGQQLGKTGDGGVDGVIREDRLGLDRVYLQAKRYNPTNTVGSSTVQAFMGALIGQGAQKGVLITTSSFSKSAINAANQSGNLRLILINGDELADLLIQFNVGVRVARTVEIKRIDLDYFEDAADVE